VAFLTLILACQRRLNLSGAKLSSVLFFLEWQIPNFNVISGQFLYFLALFLGFMSFMGWLGVTHKNRAFFLSFKSLGWRTPNLSTGLSVSSMMAGRQRTPALSPPAVHYPTESDNVVLLPLQPTSTCLQLVFSRTSTLASKKHTQYKTQARMSWPCCQRPQMRQWPYCFSIVSVTLVCSFEQTKFFLQRHERLGSFMTERKTEKDSEKE